MKSIRVNLSKLAGNISAPPSKSHTLRAILFASMANGTSRIYKYLHSPDTTAMIEACQKLGAQITVTNDMLEITGVAGEISLPDDVINAGNSGQVLRFVAAIAALAKGYSVITGDHSVRFNRPIKPLLDALQDLGAFCVSTKGDGHAPVIIKGPIKPGVATLNGSDSQPVSAILIASAFMVGQTDIMVLDPGEKPWVGLTLAWFDRLGIKYINANYEKYTVFGGNRINAFDYIVPGDFSSIAYPIAGAILTKSSIKITNIDVNDAQGDKKVIDVFRKMGAKIYVTANEIIILPSEELHGCDIDVNEMIDALPILTVFACFSKGKTRLLNAAIARKKESDRLQTITAELRKMGAKIDELEDSLIIYESKLHAAIMQSYNDHRIAMALIIAGITVKEFSTINNVQCISKSYAEFYSDMLSIGSNMESIV